MCEINTHTDKHCVNWMKNSLTKHGDSSNVAIWLVTDRLTGAFIGRLFNCVCFGADEGVEVCVCVCMFTLGFVFMNTLSINMILSEQPLALKIIK